jgi:hypothetical protein
MHGEYLEIWKEAVVVCFQTLSCHSRLETEEKY